MQQPTQAYQYTSRMMPCTHRQVDVSGLRQPRERGHISEIKSKPRWQFGGWLPARREAPIYHQVAEPRRLRSQHNHVIYIIGRDYNKMQLQQLAVTAGCLCGVLLYCGDESVSPNKWGTVYAPWYLILHHHQPRGRRWRCRPTHDMLQRIELIRTLPYTFHT